MGLNICFVASRTVLFVLLAVFICTVHALTSPSAYARLGKLPDGPDGGLKKFDVDTPPVDRARALFESVPDREIRPAIVWTGTSYYVYWPQGIRYEFNNESDLLDYIEAHRRSGDSGSIEAPIMSEIEYFKLRDVLARRSASDGTLVRLSSGETFRAHRVEAPDGRSLPIEVRPNFLFEPGSILELKSLDEMFEVSFSASDSRVMSLLSKTDFAIRKELNEAAGEFHIDMTSASASAVLDRIRSQGRRVVVIVGHIEDDHFVVRGADGRVENRVAIAEMERVAKEVDSNLILLGCDSVIASRTSSGLTAPVRDFDVVRGISQAMRQRDYGGFLSALGTETAPFLIRTATVHGHSRMIEALRLDRKREMQRLTAGTTTIVVVAGRSPAVVAERIARIVPFIPVWLHWLIVAGYAGAAFLVRSLWHDWVTVFPILSFTRRSQIITLKGLRLIGFAIVAPLYGLLGIFLVLLIIPLFFVPFLPWSVPAQLLLAARDTLRIGQSSKDASVSSTAIERR